MYHFCRRRSGLRGLCTGDLWRKADNRNSFVGCSVFLWKVKGEEMDKYIKANDLIRELSEISGELNAQNIGAAIGRVPLSNVINRKVYELALDQLCSVRDQLDRERQLVRELITELGRRYEHN